MAEEKSEFIVIEKHGGWEYATIVTDEEGNVKVFSNLDKAMAEADECQDGIVIGDELITVNTETLIKDIDNYLGGLLKSSMPLTESERIGTEELRTRLKEYL